MKFDQIFQGHDARSLPPFQQRRKFDPLDSHIPRQRLLLQGELRPQKGYKSTCELRNLVRCTNCPCSAPRSRIHSDPFPEQHIPLRHVIELRLQFSISVVRNFTRGRAFAIIIRVFYSLIDFGPPTTPPGCKAMVVTRTHDPLLGSGFVSQ